mmetsp:Transcript_7600/g.19487  ORF Transcript_7600/g.19487 Transcript_7600/m.19487 type:complete len:201 (-) Transcript_7600:210-812(-)
MVRRNCVLALFIEAAEGEVLRARGTPPVLSHAVWYRHWMAFLSARVFSLRFLSPSAVDPDSPSSLTSALPTMTPSAPQSLICLACSGFETPNPTATDLDVASCMSPMSCSTFAATFARAPVTPARLTRYTKPWDASAMSDMRGFGVVGVTRRTNSKPADVAADLIGPVSSMGRSGTSNPLAPHSLARAQNVSIPIFNIGL